MKIVLFANTDWYLYNFRLSLATAIRDAGHDVLLISPDGLYGRKLEECSFRWLAAPMDRASLNPISELKLIRWLTDVLRREQFDLIHGFTIKCAIYGSLAARFAGVPARVNAVAGMGYVFSSTDMKARILRPVVRLLMQNALDAPNARLILQNPDDVDLFKSAKLVDEKRVRLIAGSGVNCSKFSVSPDRQENERVQVLLPARLLWDKGVQELADAAKILKSQGYKIRFLLAGDPDLGNPAAVPEHIIRGWENEDLVEWLGHIDDMPALFNQVDIVVLPSYREGLPKGLIEAAACSAALVTTDVPGCREVVDHEINGLLVPAKDASALAAAIARLHDDKELRLRLGRGAREKALSEFDEQIVISKTLDVYRELLDKK